ncbi:uncharacterized protein LOC126419868 [Schistocerca serialis cubense]|uniref:uncharacterized protein LOC126419868 n=1 Tax=Schistocerca serialis cubense TaxID=2023355 RepID=UPI00214EC5E7|nr:uncharacterized protein LOC126419868 [Schistocerca serialis cubense]
MFLKIWHWTQFYSYLLVVSFFEWLFHCYSEDEYERVSAVGAHPAHKRARQEDKADRPLQQHTSQPFGGRTKANRQHQLQPRRHTPRLQRRRHTPRLQRRGHSLHPKGNIIHRKRKHAMLQQNQELRDTKNEK